MMTTLDKQLMLPAVLLFLAAGIFAGALVWQDTVGGKYVQQTAQQSATAPNGQNPAVLLQDLTASEGSIPHYAAGNLNGTITSGGGSSLTLAVIPPGSTTAGSVKVTVIVDSDTQIFKTGAPKDPATYNQEVAAYQADPSQYASAPQPYATITLKLSDLSAGEQVNVLPKAGSVQGTTLHAQVITPLDLASSAATSSVPATQ